jgi:DNA repair exonuclease SbcCD ATPase subunit
MRLTNFMSYDEVAVDLPKRGVVLVTGANGEGKSSIIEAVAAGCWNKTLRGTPWWREDAVSTVDLDFGSPVIGLSRTRKSGKNNLSVVGQADFDTAKKAQAYVDEAIPSFDVWRKTSVFTSASVEGMNFSSLGDGAQKRLLETILGLDRFDPALAGARAKLKKERSKLAKDDRAHEVAGIHLDNAKRKKEAAIEDRGELPTAPAGDERAKIEEMQRTVRDALRKLAPTKRQLEQAGVRQSVELDALREKLDILGGDACPTCDQPIPDQLRDELIEQVEAAEAELKQVKEEAEAELVFVSDQIEELNEDGERLRDRSSREEARANAYKEAAKRKGRIEKALEEVQASITRLTSEKAALKELVTKHEGAIKTLEAVEVVLGLKGVRAQVLGRSLHGLTHIANRWLGYMGGIQIELASQRERADGKGLVDEIHLAVHGAGGGFGYDACSVGQRRRIDVSLLLGVAKVSHAAYGMPDGNLWFDEVFDVLDPPGTEGVGVALKELAASRCVIVVSHADNVQRILEPVMHLHVEGGHILEM